RHRGVRRADAPARRRAHHRLRPRGRRVRVAPRPPPRARRQLLGAESLRRGPRPRPPDVRHRPPRVRVRPVGSPPRPALADRRPRRALSQRRSVDRLLALTYRLLMRLALAPALVLALAACGSKKPTPT